MVLAAYYLQTVKNKIITISSRTNWGRLTTMCLKLLYHWGFTCQTKPSCDNREEALLSKHDDNIKTWPTMKRATNEALSFRIDVMKIFNK